MVRDNGHRGGQKPRGTFQVQAAWFLHPSFEQFVSQCWEKASASGVMSKLNFLGNSLQLWNRKVFDHLFDRKFRCLGWLAGVQQALQQRNSARLEVLELSLCSELNLILT